MNMPDEGDEGKEHLCQSCYPGTDKHSSGKERIFRQEVDMDPKVRDRLDKLAKLVTEYENLNTELMELLPPKSVLKAGEESMSWTLTEEGLAKWDWITSRLREIHAWMRQNMEKIRKIERENASGR